MDHKELIRAIHHVFDGVRLEGGTTLRQAHAKSYYPDDRHKWRAASSQPVPEHWGAVSDDELDECAGDIIFLDWRGFRFYLPALMTWSIRGHRGCAGWCADQSLLYCLGHFGPKRRHEMCAYLGDMSGPERRVVAAFLAYLVIEHRDLCALECLQIGNALLELFNEHGVTDQINPARRSVA